ERARVVMSNGEPAANIFAAGEIMAGNILGQGYVAGVGMTIGTVFGRIAGEEAGRHAVSWNNCAPPARAGRGERLPVLRRILPGVSRHGKPAAVCERRSHLSREP